MIRPEARGGGEQGLPSDVIRSSIFQDIVRDLAGQETCTVENGLYALGELGWVSPKESIEILGLASQRVSQWVADSDPELVMHALSGSLESYLEHASGQDDPEVAKEFIQTTGMIIAGIVQGKPMVYEDFLSETIESELFGMPKQALASGLVFLAAALKENPKQTDLKSAFTEMLDDTLEKFSEEDKGLRDVIKSHVPIGVIADEIGGGDFPTAYPQVARLAREMLVEKADTLVAALVASANEDEDIEFLTRRIARGELGDPLAIFSLSIKVLYDPNKPWKEDTTLGLVAQELWLSALDYMVQNKIERRDSRLEEARREIIGKQWYWGLKDGVVFSALDAFDGGMEIEELTSPNVFDAIINSLEEEGIDKKVLARIALNKDVLAAKFGRILEELAECDRENLEEQFSNDLLVICLDPGEDSSQKS